MNPLTRQNALDQVFARVPEAIVFIDAGDRVLDVNPEFTKIFGYASMEACGRTINELVVPEERWAEGEAVSVRGRLGVLDDFESVRKHKNGTRIDVSVVSGPVTVTGSQVARYIIYRDITERKRIEQRLRRVVDANIIGVCIWKLDGQIIDANDEFLRMIGYNKSDMSSGSINWIHLTPVDWALVGSRSVTRIRSIGSVPSYEMEICRKDGLRLPVLLGGVEFGGASDEGMSFLIDLTDLRRAQQSAREGELRYNEVRSQLAHANRIASIAELSAAIAHELNQPLSGVVINASTCLFNLSAVPHNVEDAVQATRRTIRDANRASEVVSRLRAMFAKRDLQLTAVELDAATQEVLDLLSLDLQRNHIILQTEFAVGIEPIIGDRVQLQQVILNLVRNSMDAMRSIREDKRHLVIGIDRGPDNAVCLSLRDSGVGFDPNQAERLFEPFYSTKGDGMGIGLAVSRSIVELHGGRIWAKSNGDNGTTFFFTIPAAAAP